MKTRFEVTGEVNGVGIRKHVISALEKDAATEKFRRAYVRTDVKIINVSKVEA